MFSGFDSLLTPLLDFKRDIQTGNDKYAPSFYI